MKLASIQAVAQVLNNAGVRYLIAGGLAVNAHGYLRLTQDVDLVIQLRTENVIPAFSALASLGYRPTVPVTAAQFADEKTRLGWIADKGMKVLNLYSTLHPHTTVDVFVSEPFPFDAEYGIALTGEIVPGVNVRFVSIPTLIKMKEAAGRPKDLDDIQHLRWILDERTGNES